MAAIISSVAIENFRSIKEQVLTVKALSLLIGNNGTGKTSVLEAIHFALSPRFSAGRIKHTDFCEGSDDPIKIRIEFDKAFIANLPDGFATQRVECNAVVLEISKREKAGPGKAFSDGVVMKHHVLPNRPKDTNKGWVHQRKTRDKPFEFDERLLSLSQVELEEFPKCFYFAKDRDKQLRKGFNSSISSVFEDFNWRFARGVRNEVTPEGAESFFEKKANLEKEITAKVDGATLKKSFDALNGKLVAFGLRPVSISFIDGHAPFDGASLIDQHSTLDLPVGNLGSGEEMLISLLFLETLASLTKEAMIVLIDEPELHLHPSLQEKWARYLIEMSKSTQIIVSTHSPYFFRDCVRASNAELIVTKVEAGVLKITNTGSNHRLLPWSPSWGEINYLAYGLPTIEFHDELYGRLHELHISEASDAKDASQRSFQKSFDDHLLSSISNVRAKMWTQEKGGVALPGGDVSLQTFIRNKAHHPENATMQSIQWSPEELKLSLDQMIVLLRSKAA